jgi:hypothetical protein
MRRTMLLATKHSKWARTEQQIDPMTSTQYATNMARMAAEMVMAAANCGGSIDARARAEKLLDDYFALVEQAVSWIEHNPLDRRS